MKTIRIAVFALATGLFTLSLGAETVTCDSCDYVDGLTGSGVADARDAAYYEAWASLDNYSCDEICQYEGGSNCKGATQTAEIDWSSSTNVYYDGMYYAQVNGFCQCYIEFEEMSAGPRVEVPSAYTSPIFSPVVSFWKRLFGRGK